MAALITLQATRGGTWLLKRATSLQGFVSRDITDNAHDAKSALRAPWCSIGVQAGANVRKPTRHMGIIVAIVGGFRLREHASQRSGNPKSTCRRKSILFSIGHARSFKQQNARWINRPTFAWRRGQFLRQFAGFILLCTIQPSVINPSAVKTRQTPGTVGTVERQMPASRLVIREQNSSREKIRINQAELRGKPAKRPGGRGNVPAYRPCSAGRARSTIRSPARRAPGSMPSGRAQARSGVDPH
jgi:hypothetical protein